MNTVRDYLLRVSHTHTHTHMRTHAHAHTHTHTHTHTLVSTAISTLSLPGSGFQHWIISFLWVSQLSPASATSFSQQQLTTTVPQQSSDWLTDWLTHSLTHSSLTGPTCNNRHGLCRKHHSSDLSLATKTRLANRLFGKSIWRGGAPPPPPRPQRM
jgi:hypothetical protein